MRTGATHRKNEADVCSEKALLLAVQDTESVQAMLANVKLSMPGMQKVVQEQKKAKKKGKAT
jgi:hypothetical protein